MKITFISDTHWLVRDPVEKADMTDMLPGGPILVHAGDVSGRGTPNEIRDFLEWFSELPYMHKILIAGNHDFLFEADPKAAAEILADYPNMFADMSAGSGLNALTRDEDHTRGFLDRHQDKILYGSDCDDRVGSGPACSGSQTIAAIRKLAPHKAAERKILFENAKKLFRL